MSYHYIRTGTTIHIVWVLQFGKCVVTDRYWYLVKLFTRCLNFYNPHWSPRSCSGTEMSAETVPLQNRWSCRASNCHLGWQSQCSWPMNRIRRTTMKTWKPCSNCFRKRLRQPPPVCRASWKPLGHSNRCGWKRLFRSARFYRLILPLGLQNGYDMNEVLKLPALYSENIFLCMC